jgi:membrane protein
LKQKFLHTINSKPWIKTFTLPGFEGVPVYDVVKKFLEEIKADNITTRASSISFFFILALFPTIIFLFSIFPYVPIPNFQQNLMLYLKNVIPTNVFGILEQTINDIVGADKSGSLVSINFFMALFISSNGVNSILKAFDKTNHTFKKRNFFQKKIVAFKILFLISFQLILTVTLIIKGREFISILLNWLNTESSWIKFIIRILINGIIFFSTFNLYALIYYFGPSSTYKYRYFSVGATFATIVSILFSYIFSIYTNYLNNFNMLYGSLGIIIVIMLWININSLVLLFGFELNHSILLNKIERKQKTKDTNNLA